MADRKAWREEKPRSRRHEDREREGSLLFSSPLKPITIQAPPCFNSFEGRKQRVGRLRPRKGCARLVGQESAQLDLQKPTGAITRDELQKALLNGDGTKVRKLSALMRERAFCVISSPMLLERFPEVQSLDPKDKWRLIDELWCDLARQVEGEAPNANIVELLEKRFSDYLVDPSQGQSADDVFARLAEHKRQWK